MNGILRFILNATNRTGPAVNAARAGLNRLRTGASGVGESFGKMNGALAAVGLGVGTAQVTSWLVNTNKLAQSLQAQLKVTEGSLAASQQRFAAIEDFAVRTPFEIENITKAFLDLRAAGVTPTADMLESFGDVASSRGKDITDFTAAVQDALTGEMERLKEFGIVSKQSGDQVAFTFNGVTKTVPRTRAAILAYLQSVGKAEGVQGSMAEQMNTLGGVFSNISDSAGSVARMIGEEGFAGEVQGAGGSVLSFTDFLKENRAQLGYWTRAVIATIKFAWQLGVTIVRLAFNLGETIGHVINAFVYHVIAAVYELRNEVAQSVNWIIDALNRIPGVEIDRVVTFEVEMRIASDAADAALADARSQLGDMGDSMKDLFSSWVGMQEAFQADPEARGASAGVEGSFGTGGIVGGDSSTGGDAGATGGNSGRAGRGGRERASREPEKKSELDKLEEEARLLSETASHRALSAREQERLRQLQQETNRQSAAAGENQEELNRLAAVEQELREAGRAPMEREIAFLAEAAQLRRLSPDETARLAILRAQLQSQIEMTRGTAQELYYRQQLAALDANSGGRTDAERSGQSAQGIAREMQLALGPVQTLEEAIGGALVSSMRSFSQAAQEAFGNLVDGSESAGAAFAKFGLQSVALVAGALSELYFAKAIAYVSEGIAERDPSKFAAAGKAAAAGTAFAAVAGAFAAGGGGGGKGGGGGGRERVRRDADGVSGSGRGQAVLKIEGGFLDMRDPRQREALAGALGELSDFDVVIR